MYTEYLDLDTSNGRLVTVWPVPYEGTVSFGTGTENGPAAILRASAEIETWNEAAGLDLAELVHFTTLPAFHPPAAGPESVYAALRETLRNDPTFHPAQDFLLTLGGEHSVALAPIAAYAEAYPDLVVLQIDAHADLRPHFEGTPYSHACVMARVRELGVPLAQIGIRSLSRGESEMIHGADPGTLLTMFAHDLPAPAEAARQLRAFINDRPVYISFDADGLDPSVLPGTGTPEPGGLQLHWLEQLWEALWPGPELVGLDFCEMAPLPGAGVVSESVAVQAINAILLRALRH